MPDLLTSENLIAFATLASLEIVLGIDNLVFISILTARVDRARQSAARRLGLFLAMFLRIALLFAIGWVMRLETPLFPVLGHEVSGKDLILLLGGLFLIAKATWEIHDKLQGGHDHHSAPRTAASFGSVIAQIVMLDAVFSLDSVITAVGMVKSIPVMVAAVVVAVAVMMIFANAVSRFIERNPTLKILALSFLILIGVLLVAEGFDQHIDKGYVYFAMAFSLGVELLNMRLRTKRTPVRLHNTSLAADDGTDA